MIDLKQYKVLTFDCYGTMIDWESGILSALYSVLSRHNISLRHQEILERFAEFESEQERGDYQSYRQVLRQVVVQFGQRFGFSPSAAEIDALPESIQHWPPFPDTVAALKILKQHYALGVISNVDEDLFADSAQKLQVPFDYVITAQQVQHYKPSRRNFEVAFERIGLPQSQILHVAASLYHDIVTARSLGLSNVWVNRRQGQEGSGAALPTTLTGSANQSDQPDLEVPDLKTLADLVSQVS